MCGSGTLCLANGFGRNLDTIRFIRYRFTMCREKFSILHRYKVIVL